MFATLLACLPALSQAPFAVVVSPTASAREKLAAREVVRYVYLRTGELLPIRNASNGPGIFLSSRPGSGLKSEEYRLETRGDRLEIVGGDDLGVLYGAYRFAEKLGVRFYLHGDVVPDTTIPLKLPKLNEIGRPLFAVRGILPFHDFPEGPDWWGRDDHLAVVGQLAKMRMNFVGFHAYPFGSAGPEPLVWMGKVEDLEPDGKVKRAYPTVWASTKRDGAWGYAAAKTSEFLGGADQLFPADDYGPEPFGENLPMPAPGRPSIEVFNRVGEMLGASFGLAHKLGVKTCVGPESPMTVPPGLQESDVRELYRGMFERIRRAYPADYVWLWTPEGWTWSGNTQADFDRTVRDILIAKSVLPEGMKLATSGWVLGPQNDRSALDQALPKDVPVSAINRQVGHSPVDAAFGEVSVRSKWAIPWLENDPDMTAPQLWAGRMRYDAADARRLGCDGLIGIHWRTRGVAPNVSALASAAWDQSWAEKITIPVYRGPAVGGETASFTDPVEGTDDPTVYQTVRYGMSAYQFDLPDGRYDVTLKFNEPFYSEPGKRIFGVEIQGQRVIDRLNLFARFGRNHAHDERFPGIEVKGGRLRVEFVPEVEFACIAGIEIVGQGLTRRVNCGGPAYRGYEADRMEGDQDRTRRSMAAASFYRDFAGANFGVPELGPLLARIDGRNLPETAAWLDGPGGIKIAPYDPKAFAFVDKFASYRKRVSGTGNSARFERFLNDLRYLRGMAIAGGKRFDLDAKMAALKKGPRTLKDALAARIALAKAWDEMTARLMETVETVGDLGTVANLEQHVLRTQRFVDAHDDEIRRLLGADLPPEARLSRKYTGPGRVIVPTLRSLAAPGEKFAVKAILLGGGSAVLRWRPIGSGPFHEVPFKTLGRQTFLAEFEMPSTGVGAEYFVVAKRADGSVRQFPPSGAKQPQTVVLLDL
jgi:hypothetical protein